MDITTVETADKQTLYMTILGGWGLISDIDIESESLRKIGQTRFLLGKVLCCAWILGPCHTKACAEYKKTRKCYAKLLVLHTFCLDVVTDNAHSVGIVYSGTSQ